MEREAEAQRKVLDEEHWRQARVRVEHANNLDARLDAASKSAADARENEVLGELLPGLQSHSSPAAALEERATSNPAAPMRDQCTLMLSMVEVFSATISTPVLLPAVAVGLIDEPRLLARTGR